MKRKRISVFCLFAVTLIFSVSAIAAESACEPLPGTIETSFTSEGCPAGSLCTAGTIEAGALTGSTFFYATSFEVHGVVTFFCGIFTVTTDTGTATFDTCGTLNNKNGRYEETFTLTSATGSFENKSGRLVSTGSSTGTGFQGVFEGVLCSD